MLLDNLFIAMQCKMAMAGAGRGGMLLTNIIDDIQKQVADSDASGGAFGKKVNEVGSTGVNIGTRIALYIAIIGFIIAGVKLLTASGQDREDAKKSILTKVVGVVFIVAAVGIVATLATLATGLFGGSVTPTK